MKPVARILSKPLFIPSEIGFPLGIVLFAFLTALGAYIYIPLPFTPVPITLQTLFVLLSAVNLGPIRGALAQTLYLLLGVFGVPFFAGGVSGIAVLFGPTGGYLVGFILATALVGVIYRKRSSSLSLILGLLAGEFVIFLFGVLFLSFYMKITISKAIVLGLVPFIPGESLKVGFVFWFAKRRSER